MQTLTNGQLDSPASAMTSKPTFTPHELVDDRTATSSMYLNKDGSITKTVYMSPHFYQDNGSWQPIDMTLETDDNAADSSNIFGEALGAVESLVSTPNAYKTTANGWEARFTPSDFSGGMVRIEQGSSQVGFSPVNANTVDPVITTDANGQQVVHYNNLWSGIDVEYTVESDQVKEAVVINNKQAASQVQFTVIGADLQKPSTASTPTDPQPAFTITGALNNQFGVSPANLILNHYGFVDPTTSGLTQSYSGDTLTVGVNSSYLQSLPANAFRLSSTPLLGACRARSELAVMAIPFRSSRVVRRATPTLVRCTRATSTTAITTGRAGMVRSSRLTTSFRTKVSPYRMRALRSRRDQGLGGQAMEAHITSKSPTLPA